MSLCNSLVTDDLRTWPAGRRLDAVVATELVSMEYPALYEAAALSVP